MSHVKVGHRPEVRSNKHNKSRFWPYSTVMIHSITLILDIGIVYIFFDQNFLPTKNFFDLKLFFDQKFLRPIFRPKFFSTKNVFGQKCFNQFFDQKFFFRPNFVFTKIVFWTKIVYRPKHFCDKFFDQHVRNLDFFYIQSVQNLHQGANLRSLVIFLFLCKISRRWEVVESSFKYHSKRNRPRILGN